MHTHTKKNNNNNNKCTEFILKDEMIASRQRRCTSNSSEQKTNVLMQLNYANNNSKSCIYIQHKKKNEKQIALKLLCVSCRSVRDCDVCRFASNKFPWILIIARKEKKNFRKPCNWCGLSLMKMLKTIYPLLWVLSRCARV